MAFPDEAINILAHALVIETVFFWTHRLIHWGPFCLLWHDGGMFWYPFCRHVEFEFLVFK